MRVHILVAVIALVLLHTCVLDRGASYLQKLERNWVTVPEKGLGIVLVAATGALTMSSIIAARKTRWAGDEKLTAMALVIGIVLGFTADVSVAATASTAATI